MVRKENKVRFCALSEVLADWKWLLTYSRRCKKMIALYIALGVLGTTVGLFGSVAGKYLIDIVTGYDTARLPLLVFAAIGSTAVSIAFDCVVSRVLKKLEIDLNNNVRADVFDRILDADWQALHAFSCGDILNRFEDGTEVTPLTLVEAGIVKDEKSGIKVLGNGELTKKLTVKAAKFSKTAEEAIVANGGSVEVI